MTKVILLLFSCIVLALGCTEPNTSNTDPSADTDVTARETGFTYCVAATPSQLVNQTRTCEGCNRNDVEACARTAANGSANSFCAARIPAGGGDAACDPADYTDDICVDDTATGVTSSVQFGSDTACGVWPGRHAKWRVTYRVAGGCGYYCRAYD